MIVLLQLISHFKRINMVGQFKVACQMAVENNDYFNLIDCLDNDYGIELNETQCTSFAKCLNNGKYESAFRMGGY